MLPTFLLIFFITIPSISCDNFPKYGRIVVVDRAPMSDIVYVTNMPKNVSEIESHVRLIVLPTGSEERKDIVRDFDNIWARIVDELGWGVICPASSQGFPYEIPKNGYYGMGGESVISDVVRDARHREFLQDDSRGVFLIHLWGGGSAVLRIVEMNPGVFEKIYLAPSATVDLESLDEYDRIEEAPGLWIVLGNHGHKPIEKWATEETRTNVAVLKAPFPAPYETVETEKTMEEIALEYAEFIVNLIKKNDAM
jgi:hypothetical protein